MLLTEMCRYMIFRWEVQIRLIGTSSALYGRQRKMGLSSSIMDTAGQQM